MEYVGTKLENIIEISEIYSIHYFEYMSDFKFEGETHDFWEMLYVDKGEVEVVAEKEHFICQHDEIIFHKPNEFHALSANGVVAPNLVVLSFACLSKEMNFFENRRLLISNHEKKIMSAIIVEAKRAFSSPLDKTYLYQIERREDAVMGSEQLIRLYLEQFLISLLRRYVLNQKLEQAVNDPAVSALTKANYEKQMYERIIGYMDEHIREFMSIDEICKEVLISRSKIQNIFHDRHDCGVMQFFTRRKIELGKQLIRNSHMNFTEIADELGYTSVHYFSRQFKKTTHMTPSEYVSSVKGMAEAAEKTEIRK